MIKKFSRIHPPEDLSVIQSFCENQQRRLNMWRDVDIFSLLEKSGISNTIGINKTKRAYYILSDMIVQAQEELNGLYRNYTRAKMLSIVDINQITQKDIKISKENVQHHTRDYIEAIRQFKIIWESLMRFANFAVEDPFR